MLKSFDLLFIFPILLLILLGITILFSVNSSLFPVQFLYIILAVFSFFILSRTDKIILEGLSIYFYALAILLLVVTLVIGVLSHGAIRWLPLGPLTIQTSEFAKPIVVLATAWVLGKLRKFGFLISLALSILISFLTFIQPDFGTSFIIFAAWIGTIFAFGLPIKTLLRFFILGLIFIPLIWFLLAPYQKQRVFSFLNHEPQGASYQSLQSMISIGSGGIFGRGLGQGSQTQLSFLPARQTDFVFASIGEELGLVGASLVIAGFLILFLEILKFYNNARETFSKSVIGGILFYLFVQAFINIAMNLGILPVAGIPLPLVSAGGSALVSTMMSLGIVLALRK